MSHALLQLLCGYSTLEGWHQQYICGGYLEKADMVGCVHGYFQKALLHLYNSNFSYLMLLLQQSSFPDPGIASHSAYPFISARAKD